MVFDLRPLVIGRLYSRPELASLWGYTGYQAIGRGVFTPRGGGFIVLFVTRQKQASLTPYNDFLNGDYLHWEGEEGHSNDDRIRRSPETGEEIHLFYRDIHHTPFRYHGPIELVNFVRNDDRPSEAIFRLVHDLSPADDIAVHAPEIAVVAPTEREQLVRARMGQGRFRERLLDFWESCAVTEIRNPDLLRASHIKPWRESNNTERLDPFNGLLLLPQYDHLFDRGYITFDNTGLLIPSRAIETLPADRLGVNLRARLRRIEPEHAAFLDFHREHVFWADRDD
ncbi:MAG TPA: HNH endonuclease signature motif containing protein [Longimicrobiales bacterium]